MDGVYVDVTFDVGGNLLVVWSRPSGAYSGPVFGRWFDRDGTPVGGEFTVFELKGWFTRVAARPDGGAIAVSAGRDETLGTGVLCRSIGSPGEPLGPVVRVDAGKGGSEPTVVVGASGAYWIAWHAQYIEGPGEYSREAVARRFASDGSPDPEIVVNDRREHEQAWPCMAIDGEERVAVLWSDWRSWRPERVDISGCRLDRHGRKVGADVAITDTESTMEINSLVLRNRAGACYCVWEADGNQYGCRLDGRLGRLGSPLQLNVRPRTNAVSGCMRGDGSVVLVWTAGDDSVLRTLDRQGQLLGDELVVQADPAGSQLSPHIALGPGGRLAVGWYETAPGQGSPATARVALFVPIDGAREDCNGNGVEDSGDVTLGTSSDRDENGVPDECQGGMQLTGDCDQDGTLNMADALCLLGILFLGEPAELPCSDGLPDDSGNILLFAQSPPRPLRVTDAIRVIRFLFVPDLAVPESRALGRCVPVPGCLDSAACR